MLLDDAYQAIAAGVEWLTRILTGLLVVTVVVNVFARYVLQVGLIWAEEVTILLFVWIVFLGAYAAYRRRAHLAITFVVDRLPTSTQRIAGAAATLLTLLFLGVVVWAGFDLVERTFAYGRVTAMLGISAAWGYLAVPAAGCLIAAETLRQVWLGGLSKSGSRRQEREGGT